MVKIKQCRFQNFEPELDANDARCCGCRVGVDQPELVAFLDKHVVDTAEKPSDDKQHDDPKDF